MESAVGTVRKYLLDMFNSQIDNKTMLKPVLPARRL